MDELDIITRDGDRLKGDAARKYLDQYRAVADAIILERAELVIQRRKFVTPHAPTAQAVATFLSQHARELRQEAESGA